LAIERDARASPIGASKRFRETRELDADGAASHGDAVLLQETVGSGSGLRARWKIGPPARIPELFHVSEKDVAAAGVDFEDGASRSD
jgi:hypothetical protein